MMVPTEMSVCAVAMLIISSGHQETGTLNAVVDVLRLHGSTLIVKGSCCGNANM